MRAYPLRGQVGGGRALEFESFLGPVKWHRPDWRVLFGAQKTLEFQSPAPSHLPSLMRIRDGKSSVPRSGMEKNPDPG